MDQSIKTLWEYKNALRLLAGEKRRVRNRRAALLRMGVESSIVDAALKPLCDDCNSLDVALSKYERRTHTRRKKT